MNAGRLTLVLEPRSAWEDFPDYARKWTRKLGARQVSEPMISADECLLEVEIDGGSFWITYDDFQSSIQLEPKNIASSEMIPLIGKRFQLDIL